MDTKKRRQLIACIMGGVTFLIAGTIGLIDSIHELQVQSALNNSGIITQGVVTGLYSIPGRSRAYFVDYQYQAGETYRGQQEVSEALYSTLSTGSSIVVRYMRDNPGISGIPGQQRDLVPFIFFMPVVIFAGIVLLIAANRLLRQRSDSREVTPC